MYWYLMIVDGNVQLSPGFSDQASRDLAAQEAIKPHMPAKFAQILSDQSNALILLNNTEQIAQTFVLSLEDK